MGRIVLLVLAIIVFLVVVGVVTASGFFRTSSAAPTATATTTATITAKAVPALSPTVTNTVQPTVTSTATLPTSTPKAVVAVSNCPDVPKRDEPQGLLQADRSFVAQFGQEGCVEVFEGRIWQKGQTQPTSIHDIVMIEGARDGVHLWEGNGWLLPSSTDPKKEACDLWFGKKANWLSQGISPLPHQYWMWSKGAAAPVKVDKDYIGCNE